MDFQDVAERLASLNFHIYRIDELKSCLSNTDLEELVILTDKFSQGDIEKLVLTAVNISFQHKRLEVWRSDLVQAVSNKYNSIVDEHKKEANEYTRQLFRNNKILLYPLNSILNDPNISPKLIKFMIYNNHLQFEKFKREDNEKTLKMQIIHWSRFSGIPLYIALKWLELDLVLEIYKADLIDKVKNEIYRGNNNVFHLLIKDKNLLWLKLLIKLDAEHYLLDINAKNSDGKTPLDLAIEGRDQQVISLLTEYKKTKESWGCTIQ